jgi:hypothetical protein
MIFFIPGQEDTASKKARLDEADGNTHSKGRDLR